MDKGDDSVNASAVSRPHASVLDTEDGNRPQQGMTDIPPEKLILWHNWVSWAMFVLALVHTFPFIVYHNYKGDTAVTWQTGGVWLTGVVAIIAQAWLTFMSVSWIR